MVSINCWKCGRVIIIPIVSPEIPDDPDNLVWTGGKLEAHGVKCSRCGSTYRIEVNGRGPISDANPNVNIV